MSVFLSKIQEMQNQLKQLGENISDKLMITKFLMSIPEKYIHFVSAWESAPEDKQTFDNLAARLLIEEERLKERSGGENSESSAAFVAKKNFNKKLVKCYKCNKLGHFQSECKSTTTSNFGHYKYNRKGQRCFYCTKIGHVINRCRYKKNKEINAFVVESTMAESSQKTKWLVDSVASEHMCCERKLFLSYSIVTNKTVTVGNGTQISVHGCGQVAVEAWNRYDWKHTTIDNVLYVPELKMNLLSVNRVTSRGYVLLTKENICEFYNKQNKIVAIAKRSGNMYVLDCRYFADCLVNMAEVRYTDLHVWHEKLVHQTMDYVRDVLKKDNIEENISDMLDFDKCESCLKGKIHRLPYRVSDNVSARTCEIIHADTCGPMEEKSVGGSKYFVVFKDDYSKYTVVYFVQSKKK